MAKIESDMAEGT